MSSVLGQSQNAGDKMLDNILVTTGLLDELRQQRRDNRRALRAVHKLTASETRTFNSRLAETRDIEASQSHIAELHAALGTEQCRKLDALQGYACLCARIKARAVRANIRYALQAHQFEREKLERAYRRQILRKLFCLNHVQSLITSSLHRGE